MAQPVSIDRLNEVLSYNRNSGVFTWKVRSGSRGIGSRAGSPQGRAKNYRSVMIDGRNYLEHRLAWLFVFGRWPAGILDHINRCASDNRIANLRECTNMENRQNECPTKGRGMSAFRGVSFCKKTGKWRAGIMVSGEKHDFGRFSTELAAHAACLEAKQRLSPFLWVPEHLREVG